ncbi:response regulator transcription factor [Planomonospora venezuelensis]|uniref:Two-component system OmpR family response regulator n=1 Tax=Planomonospora venezuelensis TaxID=1999 RepID=A0A841D281_PLAVE|nr:two-component system OmpR family response regulator [Planomonospora venezuelensis]GIN00819.1 DNA-binding response regulator [Planomonospora venezuelensis]
MTQTIRILVVDDEHYLADLVATALRYEGFETAIARSGAETLSQVGAFRPDLIVLDVMLPDGSGMETCARLRRDGCEAPVVFLTAKDAPEDKIAGLTIGGDDYVTKPFSLEELIARIRAVLRRTHRAEQGSARLSLADLEIDEDAHEVRRHGTLIDLTPTEFKLLRYLLVNAGRVVSKRQILDHVWEYDFGGNDGVVQTYVSYLRRKVDASGPPLIHTVPRVGYIMRLPREA